MNSFTEENYLKTIYHLSVTSNGTVNTNAIADVLSTRAASVTDMLKKLAEKELINYIKYQGVSLTKKGELAALLIIRRHRLWELFLVEKLNFGWHEVHDVAEELEHVHSNLLIDRLDEFLGFPDSDPHGDPIPDKNGKFKQAEYVKLSLLKVNETGVITGVSEHGAAFLTYLEKQGLILGEKIKVTDIAKYDSSMEIELNNKTINISKEVSKNILIKL